MPTHPKVSIIVPIYNAQHYIKSCIKSILKQTYSHLEIILINDGSTDKSARILQSFLKKDARITVLHHKNKGPGFSRNRGLFYATGDYVQFVDADDLLHPTMTASLVEAMHQDTDLVICGYQYGKATILPHLLGTIGKARFLQEFGGFYETMIFPSPCNKLYRLSNIQNHAIRFPMHQHYGEDVAFNLDYFMHTQTITVIKKVLYQYRQHPTSITNSYTRNLYTTHEKIYEQIKDFLISNNAWHAQNKDCISTLFAEGVIHVATNLFHPDNKEPFPTQCQKLQVLLSKATVKEYLPYFKGSLQARVFRYFIEKQSYELLCQYLRRKRTIQKVPIITPILKKANRRVSK